MNTRASIPSPWRLRNDGRYLLAYTCQTDDVRHRALPPYEAIIAPFLDGTLTTEEIWPIWCNVAGAREDGNGSLRQVFEQQIKSLRDCNIMAEAGPLSPSFGELRRSFIPDFANYKMPGFRLARPLSVMVTLTSYCRTDCIYCYAERKIGKELSFDQWIDIFDELKNNEVYIVEIAGGDIFARKDAIPLLRAMVEREFVFFLSTKCPIDRSTASCLAELGIGRSDVLPHLRRDFQISVDSDNPIIADRLVRRRGYLDRARRSVENCVSAGMAPRVKSVVTSLNPEAPEGIVQFFEPLGVRSFQFVQYGRTHYRHDESLFLSLEQKLRLRDQSERIRARYPHVTFTVQDDETVVREDKVDWERWKNRSVCSAGRLLMVIKPNGDVTLCDQIPQQAEFIVANVKKTGVMGAWQSPRIGQFLNAPRDSFRESSCFECVSFDQCHTLEGKGYCFRDSLFAYGAVSEPPPNCPQQHQAGLRQI